MESSAQHTAEITTAERAVALIAELGLPPTPENYRVWFTHLSGTNPDLSRRLDALLASPEGIDPSALAELHERFFDPLAETRALVSAGQRLQEMLVTLQAMIGSLGTDTADYGTQLGGLKDQIAGATDRERLQAIVGELMRETERMHHRAVELEQQIVDSSKVIDELRRNLRSAQIAALTDALTGLANRAQFDAAARVVADVASAKRRPACLILADVDRFKLFNDTHGHQAGDEVLRLVASVLKRNVKGRDLVARYGGEEFAVILLDTELKDGFTLANRLRELIASRELLRRASGANLGRVTISVGITDYRAGEPVRGWVERADRALYEAKRTGRNRTIALAAK
jgi:diguanylate cyclase